MRLLAASFIVASATGLGIKPCTTYNSDQQWTMTPGIAGRVSLNNGALCLSTLSCNPASQDMVTLLPCATPSCPGAADQTWTLTRNQTLVSHANNQLCLTLAGTTGPGVNLWACEGAADNAWWSFNGPQGGGTGTLQVQDSTVGNGCLSKGEGPGSVAVLNSSMLGRRLFGIGGLAAVGGARLIWEYPEPQQSDILDLLFNRSGGAAYQVLKTEIEGDMDSSYGSGPSFQPTRDASSISFNRGIYLPWLVQEAKKRNPSIPLYSLSWGMPAWVGNGSFLSPEGIDYHVRWHQGAQKEWGVEYDVTGVWNERTWGVGYVKALRQALDAAGFNHTRISVNDGTVTAQCIDCKNFTDGSITTAAAEDPAFAAALGIIGVHSGDVAGVGRIDSSKFNWEAAGVDYIQSESNVIDGPMPQWVPNAGNAFGSGLSWPRVFLLNYVQARATGTILCPMTHAWTWAYGRNNHGHSQFMQPWSGHYDLGSAFWSQAQFTQATSPGWYFLDGTGSGSWDASDGNGIGGMDDWLVYASLVAPDLSAFSIVAINVNDTVAAPMQFQLAGQLLETFGAGASSLAVWTTNETDWFALNPAVVPIPASGEFNYSIPPRTVVTLTTLRSLSRAHPQIPPKAAFPLPYSNDFESQSIDQPGRLLSDLFGAFYIAADPIGQRGNVLRQAVPVNPGTNSWLSSSEGMPFSSLPAPGTAWANANVSAYVLITPADMVGNGSAIAPAICGRTPIWQPADYRSSDGHLGICLSIDAEGGWKVQQTQIKSSSSGNVTILAAGTLPSSAGAAVGAWHALSLAFVDDTFQASIDGVVVATKSGLGFSTGVYGIGSGWHTAHFDGVQLQPSGPITGAPDEGVHGPTPNSWLFDILPGEVLVNNVTGWAGFALDLTDPSITQPLSASSIGRFRARGNVGQHGLNIFDASTGSSVMPGGQSITVDLSSSGCPTTDLLGYCYVTIPSGPVSLLQGHVYYVVSSETSGPGADVTIEMTNPSAATTHANNKRDGTTLLSYQGPGKGSIAGRVYSSSTSVAPTVTGGATADTWTLIPEIDTMFGPLNLVLV